MVSLRWASMASCLSVPDEPDDLGGGRTPACLLLREHQLAVDEHIELTKGAEPDSGRHAEVPCQLVPKAHGLLSDVASDEAALDVDFHDPSLTNLDRTRQVTASEKCSSPTWREMAAELPNPNAQAASVELNPLSTRYFV
jgi:hypothetical protein